jgi:hypothetical protein
LSSSSSASPESRKEEEAEDGEEDGRARPAPPFEAERASICRLSSACRCVMRSALARRLAGRPSRLLLLLLLFITSAQEGKRMTNSPRGHRLALWAAGPWEPKHAPIWNALPVLAPDLPPLLLPRQCRQRPYRSILFAYYTTQWGRTDGTSSKLLRRSDHTPSPTSRPLKASQEDAPSLKAVRNSGVVQADAQDTPVSHFRVKCLIFKALSRNVPLKAQGTPAFWFSDVCSLVIRSDSRPPSPPSL